MLPQNIFVTLNQIIFPSAVAFERAALQLRFVATTKDTTTAD